MSLSYAIVGCPLGASLLPLVYSRLLGLGGSEARCLSLELPPEALEEQALPPVFAEHDGFHIAYSHREKIVPLLDHLEETARRYSRVTAVRRVEGRLEGANTAIAAFHHTLEERGIPLAGRICVVGLGHLGRLFASEAALAGAQVLVAVLPPELAQAQDFAQSLQDRFPGSQARALLTDQLGEEPLELLINATSTGMFPLVDEMPVPVEALVKTRTVLEGVYNPSSTLLIREAARCGCAVIGGGEMLVHQAAQTLGFWTGSPPAPHHVAELISLVENLTTPSLPMDLAGRGNILLCGFAGCGKRTIGKLVAKRTGRSFVSLGDAIRARCGKAPAQARAAMGEQRYLQLEQETLALLCSQGRLVIGADSGTMARHQNIQPARNGCRVIFLDTPLDYCLARMAREELNPQRQDEQFLMERYTQYYPMYRWASHHQVDGRGTPQEVAEKVLAAMR